MNTIYRSAAILLLILLPLHLWAASSSDSSNSSSNNDASSAVVQTCTGDINNAFARERFLYQTMLFGLQKASDESSGATRVDEQGVVWIKTGDNKWANGDTTIGDHEMDTQTVKDSLASSSSSSSDPSHPGILETQQATTSDLIPPLLQTFRAYQCRLAAVCEAARTALTTPAAEAGDTDTITVKVPGCVEMDVPALQSCEPTPLFTLIDTATLRSYCQPILSQLTTYDEGQLLYLTHYDAAHRSLRQFAGYLEPFLRLVHFPMQTPIRQASQFLRTWSRIPCFEPYCAQESSSSD